MTRHFHLRHAAPAATKKTLSVPVTESEAATIHKAARSADQSKSAWLRSAFYAVATAATAQATVREDHKTLAVRGVPQADRRHRVSVMLDPSDRGKLAALARLSSLTGTAILQSIAVMSAERQLARLGLNVSRETVLSPELKRQLDSLWETFCRAASAPPTAERAVFEASVRLRTRIYELGSGGGSTQRAALAREAENMAAKHRQTLYQVAGWLRVEPATVLAACEARALAATAAKAD